MKKQKNIETNANPDTGLLIRKTISKVLTEKRKEKGLTQTEIGLVIGCGKTTYATWEQCRSMPDVDTLYRLAQYYGVTMDEMYGIKKDGDKK